MKVPGRYQRHLIVDPAEVRRLGISNNQINDLTNPIPRYMEAQADEVWAILAAMDYRLFRAVVRKVVDWAVSYEGGVIQRGANWPGRTFRREQDPPTPIQQRQTER